MKAAGAILSFTCVDTTDPIVASSGNEGCSDTLTALEVYAEANSKLVAFYSIKKKEIDLSEPSGMTKLYNFENPQDVVIMAALENGVQISDDWTGDRVSYSSSPGDNNKWVAQLIALK